MAKKYWYLSGIALLAASFILLIFNQHPNPTSKIDPKILDALKDCAKHHTKNIKGFKSSDIERVITFSKRSFQPYRECPFFLFQYQPALIPIKKGAWNFARLDKNCEAYEPNCKKLLDWLNTHYHTNKPFEFLYYAQEPILSFLFQKKETCDNFAKIIKNCPILISCNHIDLAWTHKAVLIPDPYMISQDKQMQLTALLDSKELLPFNHRIPKFFFSGALTGPRPLNFDYMDLNPRHLLLKKTAKWPFLKYNVTNFELLNELAIRDYKDHILKIYSNLKGESVDFFEHAKYKYLLSFDGYGAAWSRVPLILATGSVLVLNAICRQYFYDFMLENVTHVNLKNDLSNGEELFHHLEKNPQHAEKIGKQGKDFAKMFLTKDATDAYLWLVLKEIENAYEQK